MDDGLEVVQGIRRFVKHRDPDQPVKRTQSPYWRTFQQSQIENVRLLVVLKMSGG
jgi:hypothetical protein